MSMSHTVLKIFLLLPLISAPVMIASGIGVMQCPDMLCKANGGTGPDKFDWASKISGVPAATLLILVGVCKLAAIVDIYFTKIMPKVALYCVSIMMLLVRCLRWDLDHAPRPTHARAVTTARVAPTLPPAARITTPRIVSAQVLYGHVALGDDLPPVVVFSILPLLVAATWPKDKQTGGKKGA